MSNLNMNKAAAAILVAGLIGMVTGKVTEYLYLGSVESGHHDEKEKRGYSIEVTEAPAGGDSAAPATAADISALYATADVKAGGDLFAKKCTVCHNGEKGAGNKIGPHLYGVVNRKVASIADFNYSSGMKTHADRTWNFEELNHFIWGPGKWVPGTMMSFGGLQKDQDRANLIAYLNSNSDSPAKLPTASAKPADKTAKGDKSVMPAGDASAAKGTPKPTADAKPASTTPATKPAETGAKPAATKPVKEATDADKAE